ncbi:MAG: Ycf51 family protein [Coleofasciculaceae cyanobacterium]
MLTTTDFLVFTKWSAILTLVCAIATVAAFIFKWGLRFRLVGATGFMGVLTGGLFALSLVPFSRTVVPDAARFVVVYDNGGPQMVITVAPDITETKLDATLRQAASDLYSYGRLGGATNQMSIRVRTVIHPQPGVSKPLFLGEVKRSLANRDDPEMMVNIYSESFAQLPKPAEEPAT